jgi:hypothetical protein
MTGMEVTPPVGLVMVTTDKAFETGAVIEGWVPVKVTVTSAPVGSTYVTTMGWFNVLNTDRVGNWAAVLLVPGITGQVVVGGPPLLPMGPESPRKYAMGKALSGPDVGSCMAMVNMAGHEYNKLPFGEIAAALGIGKQLLCDVFKYGPKKYLLKLPIVIALHRLWDWLGMKGAAVYSTALEPMPPPSPTGTPGP